MSTLLLIGVSSGNPWLWHCKCLSQPLELHEPNFWLDWDDKLQRSKPWRALTSIVYLSYIYPSIPTYVKPTRVHLCHRVTKSVFLPAQVSSVISISVVMATQQQGGKWQPNLWHSVETRPGLGARGVGRGGSAVSCRTLLGLLALNQILLTSEKNENILIPLATVLVRLMSRIFALTRTSRFSKTFG